MKLKPFLAASTVAIMAATAAFSAPAKPAAAPASEMLVTSQLPRNAAPTHYAISVTPDAANLSFTGHVSIDFVLKQASDSITLNAADIAFQSVKLRQGGKALGDAVATVDADAQTATLRFAKAMPAGNYSIDIDYSGKIYQQANGLFALDYKDTAGQQKRALFTQFEAPDARRFVPSWDEPNYKATFDLKATVPTGLMAVGNMPIKGTKDLGNGKSEVTFGTTPKMSSYLLFFGVGEFDRITKMAGPTEVGVIMGKGNAAKGQWALDSSAKIVEYYNDYFGTPYPLPKLDNVAGPGQSQFFSAMENWGAIFTFERVLLDDPKLTSAAGKQRIFSTDAHEIAHQWFGDLVTMAWWDDLWLNEGFASWMEGKATEHFYPEWQPLLDKVTGRETAMNLDSYATTHPVIQKITTVEQTSQAFDRITYDKGEAVITMLEGYAGSDTWRNGLRAYMKKHAYGNTQTDDLWNAVEGAGAKGLVQIAHDFTKQPGIPLIDVTGATCQNGNTVFNVTQGEFSRDRKAQTDANPLRWHVPVNASAGGETVSTIIADGKGEVTVPGCGTLLLNAGQTGYYRVRYTAELVGKLTADFAKLAPIDQLGVLLDNQALSRNDYQPMRVALDLLDKVDANASPKVVDAALDSFSAYYGQYKDDPATQAKLAAIASKRFGPLLTKLGMAPKAGESALDANLRNALITGLGGMGDASVQAEAKRLFAALDTDPAALDGPMRQTWLGIIAANADRPTWEKIRKLGAEAESQPVRSTMYALLGNAKDPALAQAALDLALTDEPGPTLSSAMIASVAEKNTDLAVDFVLSHLDQVNKFVDVSSRSRFVGRIAAGSSSADMPAKLDAYANTYLTPANRKPVDQAISAINTRLATEPRIKAGVSEWLANRKD